MAGTGEPCEGSKAAELGRPTSSECIFSTLLTNKPRSRCTTWWLLLFRPERGACPVPISNTSFCQGVHGLEAWGSWGICLTEFRGTLSCQMRAVTASSCYKGSVPLVDCRSVRGQIFGTTKYEILHLSRTLVLALVRKVGIDTFQSETVFEFYPRFVPAVFLPVWGTASIWSWGQGLCAHGSVICWSPVSRVGICLLPWDQAWISISSSLRTLIHCWLLKFRCCTMTKYSLNLCSTLCSCRQTAFKGQMSNGEGWSG